MRLLCALLCFFTFLGWSQEKPLEIKIDSITWSDSIPNERTYLLNYTITNLTDRKLSFFFNPNGFGGSLSNKLYYRCSQNGEFLDSGHMMHAFSPSKTVEIDEAALGLQGKTEKERSELLKKFLAERYDIHLDSIKGDTDIQEDGTMNYTKRNSHRTLMEQIFTLEPKEARKFSQKMYWNKMRYIKNDPHEYYVDEKAKHDFEITMVLLKEPFKERLSAEKYEEIITDKNFIKGVFVSNKVPIYLGE